MATPPPSPTARLPPAKFKYLDESNVAASSGSTKVRLFHAAASLGALDVYITNTSSLSGLSPDLQVSAYEEPEQLYQQRQRQLPRAHHQQRQPKQRAV